MNQFKKISYKRTIQYLLLLTITITSEGLLHGGLLHDLIGEGDVKKVKQFFKDNKFIDVNKRNNAGETPLTIACGNYGNLEIAKLLIFYGADVNKPNNIGATPLHKACYFEHLEIAKLLIFYGADVNIKNDICSTPLHCCYNQYNQDKKTAKIIKLLLLHGANISEIDCQNRTPLNEIQKWSKTKQQNLLQELLLVKQKETETKQDINTRHFIEACAKNHAFCLHKRTP